MHIKRTHVNIVLRELIQLKEDRVNSYDLRANVTFDDKVQTSNKFDIADLVVRKNYIEYEIQLRKEILLAYTKWFSAYLKKDVEQMELYFNKFQELFLKRK